MIEFTHDQARHCYQAVKDGRVAGSCSYRLNAPVITFTHTVVEPEFEGTGVGSALAKHVLDDSRSRGFKVVAACAFIKSWIMRHEEYAPLLASDV